MNTDSTLLPVPPTTSRKAIQDAVEASKKLQLALTRRAERLEAKLKAIDSLLETAEMAEGDEDPEPEILVPGSKKATGLFPLKELQNSSSPFYDEATKRSKYIVNTRPHPMKAKDLETLAAAVRQENERLLACIRTQTHDSNMASVELDSNLEGLDWTRIAEMASDSSSVKRTPTECRVIWIGDRHPHINHDAWSNTEIDKLSSIVYEHSENGEPIDWVHVAELLGTNRAPIDCMRHCSPQNRHNWTSEADRKLLNAVELCGIDNWQLVARKVSDYVTASQCQGRWQKTLNPGLKRGAWTSEEDELLRKAVAGYGNSWVQVAAAIPGRTNDQCRERWTESLKSSATSVAWTEADDKYLFELVDNLGNKWAAISSKLGNNKTGQNCRMRYEKLKKMRQKGSQAVPHTISLDAAHTLAVNTTSQLISNRESIEPVSSIRPADMSNGHSRSLEERPSTSESSAPTEISATPQQSSELQPTKPRPKPRPRRSKKIEQPEESSNTGTEEPASGLVSSMVEEASQSADMNTFIVNSQSNSAELSADPVRLATTATATDALLTKTGKREAIGRKKGSLKQKSSKVGFATPHDLSLSSSGHVQENEEDESRPTRQALLKRPSKRRAPAPMGKSIGADSQSDITAVVHSKAIPVGPSEEVELAPFSSNKKRKRKTTKRTDDRSTPSPKKIKVARSTGIIQKDSTASHVVESEPSSDVTLKLRRGRSRKTLSPSLHPDNIMN